MTLISNILALFGTVGNDVGNLIKRVTAMENNVSTYPNRKPVLNFNFILSNFCDYRFKNTGSTGNRSYFDKRGTFINAGTAALPRIDHDPNTGECLGLLIEPQSTNLLPYSNVIVGTNATLRSGISANRATRSLDKAMNGMAFTGNGVAANVGVDITPVALAANTVYTFSFYCRADTAAVPSDGNAVTIQYNDGTATQVASIPFTALTGLNYQWKRYSFTFNNVNALTASIALMDSTTSTTPIEYWGMQLEPLSFKTSLIPTSGTSGTRLLDRYNVSLSEINKALINDLSPFGLLDSSFYIVSTIDDFTLPSAVELGGLTLSFNTNNTTYFATSAIGSNRSNISRKFVKYTNGTLANSSTPVVQSAPAADFKEIFVLKNGIATVANTDAQSPELLNTGYLGPIAGLSKALYVTSAVPRHLKTLLVYNSALSLAEIASLF